MFHSLNHRYTCATNVALPDEFDKILSTMRSREISISIILQNMAQLKALYQNNWESITGNCDEYLYMGGNEISTHEYVSKMIGKQTLDHSTFGQSHGRNGHYSTNWQITGRDLLAPDEVRMLDNRYTLLFVRGERPVMDLKYDLLHHPSIDQTLDGKSPPYVHGQSSCAFYPEAIALSGHAEDYSVLSEEDVEHLTMDWEQRLKTQRRK